MDLVLQDRLPSAPWLSPVTQRLPGVQPLAVSEWLPLDEAYAGQLSLRARLLAERRDHVLQRVAGCEDVEQELRAEVLAWLQKYRPEFAQGDGQIRCPDGRLISLSDDPMSDLGHLVQQDFCILTESGDGEHALVSALLCFPASWTLSEKIGRPLMAIHEPVSDYTADIGRRVQRLFDAVQVGRPLWRQNALFYSDPYLFQPRRSSDPRRAQGGKFLRSERQSLWRLPKTRAVVFSIHTYVVPFGRLDEAQRAGLAAVATVT